MDVEENSIKLKKLKAKDYQMGQYISSDMEEVEKWSKLLIDSNSNYYIARAKHKGTLLQVLINTKN